MPNINKKLILIDLDHFLIHNSIQHNKTAFQQLFKNKYQISLWNKLKYEHTDAYMFLKINEFYNLNLNEMELSNLKREYVLEFTKLLLRKQQIFLQKKAVDLLDTIMFDKENFIGGFSCSFFNIARLKLIPFNIFHLFTDCAFGEDTTNRNDLPFLTYKLLETRKKLNFEISERFYVSDLDYNCDFQRYQI